MARFRALLPKGNQKFRCEYSPHFVKWDGMLIVNDGFWPNKDKTDRRFKQISGKRENFVKEDKQERKSKKFMKTYCAFEIGGFVRIKDTPRRSQYVYCEKTKAFLVVAPLPLLDFSGCPSIESNSRDSWHESSFGLYDRLHDVKGDLRKLINDHDFDRELSGVKKYFGDEYFLVFYKNFFPNRFIVDDNQK
jgi:hypothetical protein